MALQYVIVGVIVLLAAAIVGRGLVRSLRKSSCGDGGCGHAGQKPAPFADRMGKQIPLAQLDSSRVKPRA